MKLLFLLPFLFFCENLLSQNTNKEIDLSKNWEYRFESSTQSIATNVSDVESLKDWKTIENPNNPEGKNNSTIVWFRKEIPDLKNISNPTLFFDISKTCVVYLDDLKLYSFGEIGKNRWDGWKTAMLPISKNTAKFLYIKMYSTSHNIGFHTIKIGNHADLYQTLFKKELSSFIIGCFYAIIGVLTFAFFLTQSHQKLALSFSSFCFFSGIYLLSNVHPISSFYVKSTIFWPFAMYSSLYLLPVFGISFAEEMIGRGRFSISRVLLLSHLVFAIVSLFISFFEFVHLESTLPYYQLLLLATVVVHLSRISYHVRKGNTEAKIFSIGVACYVVVALFDLVMAVYTNTTIQGILQWGVALFLFSLVIILHKRFSDILRQIKAHTAELENKVQERTKELNDSLSIIKKDLILAKKIQTNILPADLDKLKNIKIQSLYSPMSEVGGDIFDVSEVKKNVIRIFVADATGHGVQGALITMAIKGEYESLKWVIQNPEELLEILNREFYMKYRSLNSFFSCILVDIDLQFQTLSYVSAGHPDQVYLQKNQKILLSKTGKLVGMLKNSEYSKKDYSFQKNDRLFLFSDGMYEEFNSEGVVFGEERLHELFLKKENLEKMPKTIINALHSFLCSSKFQDDLTLLCIEFQD
ncbi:MAG: serine/threonine-protein phosphatase [Leptospiraceae bacterium]|nr:SpoIIE family protein phosphatase [Leptospiraceae bacterium]MCK6381666.1 serine/threonine-protein phosphatase [Leptospiraceae bacterium]NUM40440.1 SpoIIE family protein phosphatase [Leptospiraceae bacterium]